jgi:lipid-A-disaccharide synthase
MAVILPFEEAFYRESGIRVDYVGHPLLDGAASRLLRDAGPGKKLRRPDAPVLGLLPGSREEEIRRLLPTMVQTAEILKGRYPGIRCLLPLAPTIPSGLVEDLIRASAVEIRVETDMYKVLAACDAAVVTSGTATLETAIAGVPMVIVYRVSGLTYRIARRVVQVPFIGLVNLVAGEGVVPELIQDEATPERAALESARLLDDPAARGRVLAGLERVRGLLGGAGASMRTARIALDMMQSAEKAANPHPDGVRGADLGRDRIS